MGLSRESSRLTADSHLRAFFLESVRTALRNQRIKARSQTVRYVVDLLTTYARADRLYERSEDGRLVMPPLAHYYARAVNDPSAAQRAKAWRRLGDVALFIAGLFSGSLRRKVVDVDYYIAMGGGAYGQLSQRFDAAVAGAGAAPATFGELARKFPAFVEVLDEVAERSPAQSDRDLLREYDLWLRTGSTRAAKRLRRCGIVPMPGSLSDTRH